VLGRSSELRFGAADVPLDRSDLWEVATVAWPSGEVVAAKRPDGTLKVTHNDFLSRFSPP
jgi:hypothetical protein